MKILLIIQECNPTWASVPLEGYYYYRELSRRVDVTLVTHRRNQVGLATVEDSRNIVFIDESWLMTYYFRAFYKALGCGTVNWALLRILDYPVYLNFNARVYRAMCQSVARGDYDLVHVFTPIVPRYPVKLVEACHRTPFVLGPVNGGLPYPPGFSDIARRESDHWNRLRGGVRWLPGYTRTYRQADKVLAGSTHTLNELRAQLGLPSDRLDLFFENGVPEDFLAQTPKSAHADPIRLLFVGRLVPFKCADVALEAVHRLPVALRQRVVLTIVGDGSERDRLTELTQRLGLADRVTFTGWVSHAETRQFYQQADIFCFPSIREFGGAVVLEALAAGLPCIVVDHGGIGEYVIDDVGFRIAPHSREYLIENMTRRIQVLVEDEALRLAMSAAAIERAREFEWGHKADQLVAMYHQLVTQKSRSVVKSGCQRI